MRELSYRRAAFNSQHSPLVHHIVVNMDNIELVLCPGPISNCTSRQRHIDIGPIPTYLSISSCTLSCFGSLLILITYAAFKDIRKGAQTLITLLAVADLATALGYLLAAGNYLVFHGEKREERCRVFQNICQIQSYVTTWSSLCSFGWTIALAFYCYLLVVRRRGKLAQKLIPYEVVGIWFGPILVALPLLVTGKLGYSPYATANWCFIKENATQAPRHDRIVLTCTFLGGKLWEVLSYVIASYLFLSTRHHFNRQRIWLPMAERQQNEFRREEIGKRLLWIPGVFIILRIWGTIQLAYSIVIHHKTVRTDCVHPDVHTGFFVLGILQAIGDGGQGWGNAILYVFMSSSIRKRLFVQPWKRLIINARRKLAIGRLSNVQHIPSTTSTQPSTKTVTIVTMAHGVDEKQCPGDPARHAHVVQEVVSAERDVKSSATPLPIEVCNTARKSISDSSSASVDIVSDQSSLVGCTASQAAMTQGSGLKGKPSRGWPWQGRRKSTATPTMRTRLNTSDFNSYSTTHPRNKVLVEVAEFHPLPMDMATSTEAGFREQIT